MLRAVLRRSVVEGVLYAMMVGLGEFFFPAVAIAVGADPMELGLLVVLPQFLGAGGALTMAWVLRVLASARRPWVAAAVGGQALMLYLLAAGAAVGGLTPGLIIAAATVHQVCGQAAGVGWASWMGEVVPNRIRGVWFARRNRWIHLTTFLGLAVGGLLLHVTEPRAASAAGHAGLGFATIFGLAGCARAVSCALLWGSFEPPYEPPQRGDTLLALARGPAGDPVRGPLGVGAAMLFAVCIAAPYFAPYMLRELRFDYPTYMLSQAALVFAKVVSLYGWGTATDRRAPRTVFLVAAVLVGIVPGLWVTAGGLGQVLVAQVLSGIAWGGYEVSLLSLLLSVPDKRTRSVVFTAQYLLNGVAQLLGGLLGIALFGWLDHGFAVVFAASCAGRLLVAAVAPRFIPGSDRPGRRPTVRVTGFRPHGGLVLRPVDPPPDRSGDRRPGGGLRS